MTPTSSPLPSSAPGADQFKAAVASQALTTETTDPGSTALEAAILKMPVTTTGGHLAMLANVAAETTPAETTAPKISAAASNSELAVPSGIAAEGTPPGPVRKKVKLLGIEHYFSLDIGCENTFDYPNPASDDESLYEKLNPPILPFNAPPPPEFVITVPGVRDRDPVPTTRSFARRINVTVDSATSSVPPSARV